MTDAEWREINRAEQHRLGYELAKAEIRAIWDGHEDEWDLRHKIADWLGVKPFNPFAFQVEQIKPTQQEIIASQTKATE